MVPSVTDPLWSVRDLVKGNSMSDRKKNTVAMIVVGVSLLIWFGSALFFQDWIWTTRLTRALLLGSLVSAILWWQRHSN